MALSSLTVQDAHRLAQLFQAVRNADWQIASYRTWRDPEQEVIDDLYAKRCQAETDLDNFILSIEEIGSGR